MADNERVYTTVFRADISNFSASTQQLNRYVEQVNSEFRDATASMGRWNDNAEGLRAKITQLNKLYDAESRKLKELEASYAEVVRTQGANSKAAQKLATDINNQSAKVKETKKNIDFYTDSLKELTDAGVETREELDKVNKELEEQKQAAKDLGGGVLKNVATGVVGIGAACIGAFAAVNSIVEETKELRTQLGMLETSFSEAGLGVEASKKTFNELYSVLGDSGKATEAALHLGQIAKTEEELAEYTNILTGVYSKFGDSLPVEAMAESISVSSTLGEITGNLTDAFEFSGKTIDEHNAHLATLNTAEERAAYIKGELNAIYKETGETYKEVNKDVIAANDAQNKYNQAMAELGEKAQPIITDFKLVMVDALGWILDNKDMVIAGVAGIGAAFVAWKVTTIVQGAVGAVKALSAATKGQTIAQTALNLVMKANPLGIIVTAVAGLTAAFIVLWNKCEGFRKFWTGFINGLIGGVNALIKGINKLKINIPEWVPEWGGKSLGFNIPLIPKLAKGGVVDKATLAMIGEAGKEVVMPLENNTGWIDKLADKISAKSGNTSKTYNITNKFERMETSRHALHKANIEMKRTLKEA